MRALIKLIGQDNKIMRYGVEDSLVHIEWKQVAKVKGPEGTWTIAVAEGLLTLSETAVGRWEAYYNLESMPIFGESKKPKITQEMWPEFINLIFSVWGAAKATCLLRIPEAMPHIKNMESVGS